MRRLSILMLMSMILPICICKTNAEPPDKNDAKAAILALHQQWVTLFKNQDAAGLAGLFVQEGVRMTDGGKTSVGRDVIETQYRQEFADLWRMSFNASVSTDDVVVTGDYGFARGTDTLTQDKEGKKVQETGKWMAAYRKDTDGTWKYFWSTYNNN